MLGGLVPVVGTILGLADTVGISEGGTEVCTEGVSEGDRVGKGVGRGEGSSVGVVVGEEEGERDGPVVSMLNPASKISTMSIKSSSLLSAFSFSSSSSSKALDGSDWATFQNSPTLNMDCRVRNRDARLRNGPPGDTSPPWTKTARTAKRTLRTGIEGMLFQNHKGSLLQVCSDSTQSHQ
jgi:hypothetical protein